MYTYYIYINIYKYIYTLHINIYVGKMTFEPRYLCARHSIFFLFPPDFSFFFFR
jgi:hypothetical protein